MPGLSRFLALVSVLVTTAFQVATELYAVPATSAAAPWLDGRPTTVLVAPAPDWLPSGSDVLRFVHFDGGDGPRYGLLDGDVVVELRGDLFSPVAATGLTH
ncbi:MAG TPA: DUF2437 domain-containing protein, partial [Longimicrobiales bacterium]|nr:DUF2437 domain-containing protein [Longimicrobiales bacterium]